MDFTDIVKSILEDPIGLLVNISFGVMLLPALFDTQKPPVLTSFSTGALLIILALNGSYRATAPALATFVVGILWLVLAYQRFKLEKRNNKS